MLRELLKDLVTGILMKRKKKLLVLSKFFTASRSPWKVKADSIHALEPPDELKIRPVLHQTISSAEARVVISRSNTALTGSGRDGVKSCLPTFHFPSDPVLIGEPPSPLLSSPGLSGLAEGCDLNAIRSVGTTLLAVMRSRSGLT